VVAQPSPEVEQYRSGGKRLASEVGRSRFARSATEAAGKTQRCTPQPI